MKAKFRVTQLAAQVKEVELEHPTMGPTGIMVKLAGPQSSVFRAAKEVYEASERKDDDNVRLFSACVVGWDEEAFEQPWSVDASYNYFRQPENEWAVLFLSPIVKDYTNFLPKS